MDRSSKQKIIKETQVLNDTLHEMDLIDIFRTFHPHAEQYTIFSSIHGTFSMSQIKPHNILDHKLNSKFKKTEIVSSIFSNLNTAAAAAKSLQSCPTPCDPIDSSPPGSPCPWDSPGKNTGVGLHFLLQCMKVKSESEVAQSCPTLSDPMDCSPPGSSIHGIFQARVLE